MIPCLFNLGTGEIVVVLVVVLLLFGAKRIPELARSLGRGVRSFKDGMSELTSDPTDDKSNKTDKSDKTE
ncbi:MAG: twin-arginine translocase TatA/TatE family subunit [Duncaniella sp.]|nr:twin-arginine translocase TatA/TatE family subunit [Duncaniella sp.]